MSMTSNYGGTPLGFYPVLRGQLSRLYHPAEPPKRRGVGRSGRSGWAAWTSGPARTRRSV